MLIAWPRSTRHAASVHRHRPEILHTHHVLAAPRIFTDSVGFVFIVVDVLNRAAMNAKILNYHIELNLLILRFVLFPFFFFFFIFLLQKPREIIKSTGTENPQANDDQTGWMVGPLQLHCLPPHEASLSLPAML